MSARALLLESGEVERTLLYNFFHCTTKEGKLGLLQELVYTSAWFINYSFNYWALLTLTLWFFLKHYSDLNVFSLKEESLWDTLGLCLNFGQRLRKHTQDNFHAGRSAAQPPLSYDVIDGFERLDHGLGAEPPRKWGTTIDYSFSPQRNYAIRLR